MTAFECKICGKTKVNFNKLTTGYGIDPKDNLPVCFSCCGEQDKQYMRENKKITLYWHNGEITNWPGTLRIKENNHSVGRHNIAGNRYDVWFCFEDKPWHGVQYGDMTQLLHCRQVKA